MGNTYEGYWFRSHRGSDSLKQCGLYKEDKHHPANVYDDDVKDESHVDDRVANEMDTTIDQHDLYSAARMQAAWYGLPTRAWRPTRHLLTTQLGIAELGDERAATVDIV